MKKMMKEGQELELLYTEEQIQETVHRMAGEIRAELEGRDLVVVGVLKGSFLFLADLIRELALPCEVDFVWLSTYGRNRLPAGEVRLRKDLETAVAGRDVLVVEDIVDTGISFRFLKQHLELRDPAHVAFAALVDKQAGRMVDIPLDFTGFEVDEGFLVGYGMDDAERFRHLPEIYRIAGESEEG